MRARGTPVSLTPREFALLEYLMRNAGRSLSRTMVMENVWGIRFVRELTSSTCSSNSRRNKIDPERKLIGTVRGFGYILHDTEAAT